MYKVVTKDMIMGVDMASGPDISAMTTIHVCCLRCGRGGCKVDKKNLRFSDRYGYKSPECWVPRGGAAWINEGDMI